MFAWTSEVVTTCRTCNQTRKTPQNFSSLTLNEKDYTFNMIGHGNFFAVVPRQSFACRCYSPSSYSHRSEIVFATFPDILVISILPMTEKDDPESKLLQKISLKGSGKLLFINENIERKLDKMTQVYEYQAGILTKFREGDGEHSIAVIQCGGSKDTYYAFGDKTVLKTNLCDVAYHPRLLFYRKYPYK